MKKILLGMLLTLILSTANSYVLEHTWETKDETHKVAYYLQQEVFQGGYILNPLMGKCKDRMGENGFGWKFNVADYYGCDRFQRLLNGNHKKPDPNSPHI